MTEKNVQESAKNLAMIWIQTARGYFEATGREAITPEQAAIMATATQHMLKTHPLLMREFLKASMKDLFAMLDESLG